ncbi:UNVERIFIED_CONTAM: hypothetical protein K2H54_067016 [Gekko kuhli]
MLVRYQPSYAALPLPKSNGNTGWASASVAMSDGLRSLAAEPSSSVVMTSSWPSAAAAVSAGSACVFMAAVAGKLCRGVVVSAGRPRSSNAPSEARKSFGVGTGALMTVFGHVRSG